MVDRWVELDVEVRPLRHRVDADRRAVLRARERRGRHRRVGVAEEEELLGSGDVACAAVVREPVRRERDGDGVVRVGGRVRRLELAAERELEEARVVRRIDLLDARDRGGSDACATQLHGRRRDRGRVDAGAAVVGEQHLEPAARIDVVAGDVLVQPWQFEVSRRGRGRRRRRDAGNRDQAAVPVEDLDATQAEALELEAAATAEAEAGTAGQPEDRGEDAVDRNVDRERGGRDGDVDLAARVHRERDVAADRDDPGCADRQPVRLDLLLEGSGRERHRHGGRVGPRRRERVRDSATGLIDEHRDLAGAERYARDPDELHRADGVEGETPVGRVLDRAELVGRDDDADRVRVHRAVVVPVRPGPDEDLDVCRDVPGVGVGPDTAAAEGEVPGESGECPELDGQVAGAHRPRLRGGGDRDRVAANGDHLVDVVVARVERDLDVPADGESSEDAGVQVGVDRADDSGAADDDRHVAVVDLDARPGEGRGGRDVGRRDDEAAVDLLERERPGQGVVQAADRDRQRVGRVERERDREVRGAGRHCDVHAREGVVDACRHRVERERGGCAEAGAEGARVADGERDRPDVDLTGNTGARDVERSGRAGQVERLRAEREGEAVECDRERLGAVGCGRLEDVDMARDRDAGDAERDVAARLDLRRGKVDRERRSRDRQVATRQLAEVDDDAGGARAVDRDGHVAGVDREAWDADDANAVRGGRQCVVVRGR